MRKLILRLRRNQAFTLVELMIVVIIVAILALVAIPIYSANTTAAVMSEGVAGAGTIRTALRVYAAQNNDQYTNASLANIGINTTDLNGKYFKQSDYQLTGVSSGAYTIIAGPPSLKPSVTVQYEINQDGTESGTYRTGQ